MTPPAVAAAVTTSATTPTSPRVANRKEEFFSSVMTQADSGLGKTENFPRKTEPTQTLMKKMSKGKFAREVNQYFRATPEKKFPRRQEFTCELCKKEFVDPRVLPCLHCFCVDCLQRLDLEQNPTTRTPRRWHNERFQGAIAGYFSKSEYIRLNPVGESASESRAASGESRWTGKTKPPRLKCPTCGFENGLPAHGIADLPPHYLLQHRMLVESLNRGEICLLCDLCPSEIPATSRCTKCLLNLCGHCSKAHKREKVFPDHELIKLKKNHQDGTGITRIRRQAMCHAHPEKELKLYCSTCNQVTCTECRTEFHLGHNCESSSRAAQVYTCKIKESLEKTRSLTKDTSAVVNRLNAVSHQIESKYSQVQKEINCYVDCYVEALEEHRKALLKQATQIKNGQIQAVRTRQREIEQRVQDIGHTLRFGEELLAEGSDFEVLSFAFYLLQKLEWCIKSGSSALTSALTSCVGTLQFLPDERAGSIKNRPVFGVVTTQVVSPSHCHITPEGIEALRNCREKERCEVMLVTKDSNDQRLTHGAEGIEVELRCKNGPHRQMPIFIVDHQNGVYLISFTPDVSGKLSLSISIRGVPIKGSPFPVSVRPHRVHKGVFHCCAFCSSEGNKNAVCGCGGKMPGGYLGCGHGYVGHPGQRHWSCCGNTAHKSECLLSLRNDGFYQLSL